MPASRDRAPEAQLPEARRFGRCPSAEHARRHTLRVLQAVSHRLRRVGVGCALLRHRSEGVLFGRLSGVA
jgi:hypothetical protein